MIHSFIASTIFTINLLDDVRCHCNISHLCNNILLINQSTNFFKWFHYCFNKEYKYLLTFTSYLNPLGQIKPNYAYCNNRLVVIFSSVFILFNLLRFYIYYLYVYLFISASFVQLIQYDMSSIVCCLSINSVSVTDLVA